MFKSLLLSLFLILPTFANASFKVSDLTWKPVKRLSKNGIIVYKAEQKDPETGLVPLRVKAKLAYRADRVLSVLANTERKVEWLPKAKLTKTLEKKSVFERVEYSRYHVPWPFQDRDFVLKMSGSFDKEKREVTVMTSSTVHPSAPGVKKVVRASNKIGIIKLRPINNDKETELEMTFLTDFKGNIPTFLVNFVQRKWPKKFMEGLREQLAKTDIKVKQEYKF